MSTPVKVGVFIVSVLVILAAALTFLVKTQLTPERVKQTLIPLIEKSLERNVDFGEITIGVFSGISVADLKVMQKGGEGEFFSVKSVALHYRFWPLLSGKVVVDQVLLDHPKIYFTRMPDGQFNFSDLLPEPKVAKKGTDAPSQHKNSRALAETFNLLVREVNVKAGELEYVDKFKNARSPFRYTLNNLNIKARQITFDKSFPIDLSAVVNGSNIDISGRYNLSREIGDLTVHLAPLDLVQFAPYYRSTFPGKIGAAQLSLTLEVDIQPELISSKGKIELDGVDLALDKFPDAGWEKATLGADYSLSYKRDKELLELSTLLLSFNKINLGAEGEFDLTSSEPYMVFTLLLKQLDLREVIQNMPASLTRAYQKYSFAGLIDGQVDLSGKLNSGVNLVKSIKLGLTDVRASTENLRAGVSGDITYIDKVLQTENLFLQYGDQQAQLQVKAERFPDNLFHGEFLLSAETLNLNNFSESAEVVKESPENGNSITQVKRQKTLADDIGPFDIPIDMVGTMAIKRLIYKELNFDKVTAALSFKNNRLSIHNLTSQVGDGELRASSLINLGVKGLAYQGQVALSQPNVMTLVAGLMADAKQSVSGVLQWQNSFAGKGTLPDNFLQALQLKGEFTLQDGEVKGSPLIEGLAGFLGNSDLKVLSFQSMTGQYDLRDGLAHLSGNLDSSKTKLAPKGTIDVAGRLNLNLDARLAPEIMAKLGVSKSLKQVALDQNGWGVLPLKIKGTLSRPEVGYDSTALQKQVLEKAIEKADQKLLEKIAPDAGGDAEPIRQMLDNALDKLFRK
ncbi:MAG: AsmA family protein [Desulfuromusa sp.]|jgi:AsmA protein|nr:AsmA family protein [Desulfuromusa sp.]